MKRNEKTLSLALLVASTLLASVLLVSGLMMHAQSPQSSSADKPPATATPGAAPSSVPAAKQDMSKPASASSPSASSASGSQAVSAPAPSGGEATDVTGEERGNGVGQHRIWRVPQAGNALVWKDEARQIHAGSGRHQSGIKTGEVEPARLAQVRLEFQATK